MRAKRGSDVALVFWLASCVLWLVLTVTGKGVGAQDAMKSQSLSCDADHVGGAGPGLNETAGRVGCGVATAQRQERETGRG